MKKNVNNHIKHSAAITHKTTSSKRIGYTVDEIHQLGVFPFVTTEVMGCLVKEKANFWSWPQELIPSMI